MNYERMIEDKKNEKKSLTEQMAVKKEEIKQELVVYTREWINEDTQKTIKEHSDKVFALGEEKARMLKVEIENLKNDLSDHVEKFTSEDSLWWHLHETNRSYTISEQQALPELHEAVRNLFGLYGEIMIKYNLNSSYGGRWGSHNGKCRYAFTLDFSTRLLQLCKEYKELIFKGRVINDHIEKIVDKRKRESVEDWWNTL